MAPDGRTERGTTTLRPVEVVPGFHSMAEGSVLYRAGRNAILVTASVDEAVPEFLKGQGAGWVTAEYQMHPRCNPVRRERRDGRERPVGGRAKEIERLIGRALRASVCRDRLGERSIVIDCDVLQADGGTRTSCITGGWLALALAVSHLIERKKLKLPVLRDQLAAVSVGEVGGEVLLDLCYSEDCRAAFDLNVVATAGGQIVELQGTAEAAPMARESVDAMVTLALEGIAELCRVQRKVLAGAGVDLEALLVPS
jgi:ribonuclease PH